MARRKKRWSKEKWRMMRPGRESWLKGEEEERRRSPAAKAACLSARSKEGNSRCFAEERAEGAFGLGFAADLDGAGRSIAVVAVENVAAAVA